MGMLRPMDKLIEAFKEGGGLAQADYTHSTYLRYGSLHAGWFENLFVEVWLPAVPEVKAALERGIDVADAHTVALPGSSIANKRNYREAHIVS